MLASGLDYGAGGGDRCQPVPRSPDQFRLSHGEGCDLYHGDRAPPNDSAHQLQSAPAESDQAHS